MCFMKTSGLFTFTKYTIDFKNYGDEITLVPFGDIHRSAPLCHEEKWAEWTEYHKGKKNTYFLGMGDYDDMASASERAVLSNRALHDSTIDTIDGLYRSHVDRLCKEIGWMGDKLIGLIEGNHYGELSTGITTTELMCEKLKCKHLGVSSFIRLILKHDKHHTNAVDIWGHHGLGGGRTAGASINKLENMIKAANADIYLMGHDHKKHIAMQSRLRLSDSRAGLSLENRKLVMARTGGFLKGYVNEQSSYIADKAYSPVDMGTVTITMTPKRVGELKVDKRWVELNASL